MTLSLVFNPFTAAFDWVSIEDVSGYLAIDGSNANTNIDIGAYNFTTTGTLGAGVITHTGIKDGYVVKTGNYNVLATDDVIAINGAYAMTLPTSVLGEVHTFKNIGTVTIATISTTLSQTIDGATTYLIRTTGSGIKVIGDGSNWQVTGVF